MKRSWIERLLRINTHGCIDKSFRHGKNLRMGWGCVIEEDVVVGDDVYLGNYVYLKAETRVGDKVFIGTHCRSGGRDSIGHRVTMKIGAVLSPDTVVEDDVFLGPYSMVLHQMPDGAHLPARICSNAWIGAKALIGPGVTIGPRVMLGACSFAIRDCLVKGGLYVGVPATLREKIYGCECETWAGNKDLAP